MEDLEISQNVIVCELDFHFGVCFHSPSQLHVSSQSKQFQTFLWNPLFRQLYLLPIELPCAFLSVSPTHKDAMGNGIFFEWEPANELRVEDQEGFERYGI
jgi:hypothetical protein